MTFRKLLKDRTTQVTKHLRLITPWLALNIDGTLTSI